MRRFAPIILFVAAISAGAFALLGDDSISAMKSLERSVAMQREKNQELRTKVQELRTLVRGLQNDPRVLEKTARRELGMARPDERIFVFEKSPGVAEAPKVGEK